MNDKLNLSLGEEENGRRSNRTALYILLGITVIIAAATLVTVILLHSPGNPASGRHSGERLKELALKLEKRNLNEAAVETWEEFLNTGAAGREESGSVWYRIGKIHQDNGEYERALAAYYRSESFEPMEDVRHELSGRITECLEMAGRFNAMEAELADRTSVSGKSAETEVVAEIGNREITDTEVKQLIEDEIGRAINGVAPGLAGEQKNRQKELMIENALKPENRNQWLSNYIAEELIYREAIGDKMHHDPEYKRLFEKEQRALLVRRYLNLLYSREINITEDMLREYYNSHRGEFTDSDGNQLSFREGMQQVYTRVRIREENRVQRELMNELKDRYDVVIHNSRLSVPPDTLSSGPAK